MNKLNKDEIIEIISKGNETDWFLLSSLKDNIPDYIDEKEWINAIVIGFEQRMRYDNGYPLFLDHILATIIINHPGIFDRVWPLYSAHIGRHQILLYLSGSQDESRRDRYMQIFRNMLESDSKSPGLAIFLQLSTYRNKEQLPLDVFDAVLEYPDCINMCLYIYLVSPVFEDRYRTKVIQYVSERIEKYYGNNFNEIECGDIVTVFPELEKSKILKSMTKKCYEQRASVDNFIKSSSWREDIRASKNLFPNLFNKKDFVSPLKQALAMGLKSLPFLNGVYSFFVELYPELLPFYFSELRRALYEYLKDHSDIEQVIVAINHASHMQDEMISAIIYANVPKINKGLLSSLTWRGYKDSATLSKYNSWRVYQALVNSGCDVGSIGYKIFEFYLEDHADFPRHYLNIAFSAMNRSVLSADNLDNDKFRIITICLNSSLKKAKKFGQRLANNFIKQRASNFRFASTFDGCGMQV